MKNFATFQDFEFYLKSLRHNYFHWRTICAIILASAATQALAQNLQTEVEIIQEAVGLEKKVAVADFMNLNEDAKAFWELYDEYEMERKKLGKERIEIIMDYAESYPNIADDKILDLYQRTQQLRRTSSKLQDTYFKRMTKEIGVSEAAQFWQMENYFNAMIQAEIYSQIPFIGDNLQGN